MSKLGIGVMIRHLSGNEETVDAYHKAVGKTIAHIELTPFDNIVSQLDDGDKDVLKVQFDDGSMLLAFDDGQSCCENRYMRTDDKFEDFVGATLLSMELKQAPDITEEDEDGWGETHEVQFLELMTSKGALTMASHNEHNGYYGGFAIELRFLEANDE
jgi:hypothetical protein